MRLIDADKLDECLQSMADLEWNKQVGSSKGLEDAIDIIYDTPTVNAIVIPDNATNGDVIKALFPNEELFEQGYASTYYGCMRFDTDWWNAPYKELNNETNNNMEQN